MNFEKTFNYEDLINCLNSSQGSKELSEAPKKLEKLKEIVDFGEEYLKNNQITEEECICLFSIFYAHKKITEDLRFRYELPEGTVFSSRFYNYILKLIHGPQTITFKFLYF